MKVNFKNIRQILERIEILKKNFPESATLLSLYSIFLKAQEKLYNQIETYLLHNKFALNYHNDFTLSDYLFLLPIAPFFENYLLILSESNNSQIKTKISELRNYNEEELKSKLNELANSNYKIDIKDMICFSFLQVLFNYLLSKITFNVNTESHFKNKCPVCNSKPVVSFIKDTDEVKGGRWLRCGLCFTDWYYERTKCVECGNNEDDTLEYYVISEIPYCEIQRCIKCNTYIKVFDLRKEPQSVPDLEDIATLTLDIWALEQGFTKIQSNFFGY